MRGLPRLNALNVFEAAARHQNFSRAAEELHITQSAVSHQVHALEQELGVKLFNRRPSRVSLTSQGRFYLVAVREGLEQILRATRSLKEEAGSSYLTINVNPSFAVGQLTPRLGQFQIMHPNLELRVSTSIDLFDFKAFDVDVAIHTRLNDWTGLKRHRLKPSEIVPVCSPALTRGRKAVRRPEDLREATLVHYAPHAGLWKTWLGEMGLNDIDAERGPKFDEPASVLEAVSSGLGVAVLTHSLIRGHLESGRVVIPFDAKPSNEIAYYLIYLKRRASEPLIASFRDWLLAEFEITE